MNLNDYMDYYDDYYESDIYDEYDKIQVLREAIEDKFINDELDYEEYAMLIDRLDEREYNIITEEANVDMYRIYRDAMKSARTHFKTAKAKFKSKDFKVAADEINAAAHDLDKGEAVIRTMDISLLENCIGFLVRELLTVVKYFISLGLTKGLMYGIDRSLGRHTGIHIPDNVLNNEAKRAAFMVSLKDEINVIYDIVNRIKDEGFSANALNGVRSKLISIINKFRMQIYKLANQIDKKSDYMIAAN